MSEDARRADSGPRSRWPRTAVVGAVLAAAAGIAIYLARRAPPNAEPAPLPTYELVVETSDDAGRGDTVAPDAVVRRSVEGRLAIVLRPRGASARANDARATAWIDTSSAVRAWLVTVTPSDDGSLRLVAQGDALAQLPTGPVRMIALVADAAHMPRGDKAAERAIRGGAPGVQVLALRIEITR